MAKIIEYIESAEDVARYLQIRAQICELQHEADALKAGILAAVQNAAPEEMPNGYKLEREIHGYRVTVTHTERAAYTVPAGDSVRVTVKPLQ